MEIKFITDVQINCLKDLSKIKHLVEEGVMKINKTKLTKWCCSSNYLRKDLQISLKNHHSY